MRRFISTILASAVLATVAATTGGAAAESRCDTNLVVFSGETYSNFNAIPCAPGRLVPALKAVADGPADFRLIWPASEFIQVRYAADDVPGTPGSIRARVVGLGLNRTFYLGRADADFTDTDPSYVYDGPEITIDPSRQGCLKVDAWHSVKKKGRGKHAKVRMVRVFSATTTYHTIDTVAC